MIFFIQQLVAIFHGGILHVGTFPNCHFTEVWGWNREHQSLSWNCLVHNSHPSCFCIWSSYCPSQSSTSSSSGERTCHSIAILSTHESWFAIVLFLLCLIADRLGLCWFSHHSQHHSVPHYIGFFHCVRQWRRWLQHVVSTHIEVALDYASV